MVVNIFDHSTPRDYLLALYDSAHKAGQCQSVRSFSRLLGLRNHSDLHKIMSGKRKITPKYLQKIVTLLNLTQEEIEYFELISKLERENADPEKKSTTKRKLHLLIAKRNSNFRIIEDSEIQRSPIHYFLLELVGITPLNYDLVAIQKKLFHHFELTEIDNALTNLLTRRFLFCTADNMLVQGIDCNLFSKSNQVNLAIQDYHKFLCQLATEAIEIQPVDDREFNGIALNIDPNQIPEIKQYLRDAIKEFVARFHNSNAIGATTYQLATQFYMATKKANA